MIHVEKLTKYYDDFCAVDHIDLNIEKGEIIGLLGPNGAGKTTILRMLTGYFMPTSGYISVKDQPIAENTLSVKRMIGYLPESAPLYKGMLVFDYLSHIARIRGISGEERMSRLHVLTDMCGLHGIMHKTIDTLSKGLKQRVGLAHAMMSDPEILILDEPTSGLDPNQIVEIREIIKKIGLEKTVILSTHILSEAEATCDRIVILNQGHIVADGSIQELTETTGQDCLIQIALRGADEQSVKNAVQSVHGVQYSETLMNPANSDADLVRVNVSCLPGLDVRAELYAKIKATDWVLIEFHQETKTLETIFRELTREN
jgi:ABC-2 type transport system ATP-binding protein